MTNLEKEDENLLDRYPRRRDINLLIGGLLVLLGLIILFITSFVLPFYF